MELELFLNGLSGVAKSPLAFVAYILLVIGWIALLWKDSRIKTIAKSLQDLPESQRLEALKLEYKLVPAKGLSADNFLKYEHRKFLLIAFMLTLLSILILSSLTIYRYIELDKESVAKKTMSIAYDAFARGTTTADDNRFKNAIGKVEESLRISPSYIGFMNLADIYDEIGEVNQSIWASKEAMKLRPSNPSPYVNLGMYYKDKGELENAEKNLLKALDLFAKLNLKDDEFKITILVNLGNVYYEKADNSEDQKERKQYAQKALDSCFSPALNLEGGIKNKRFIANLLGNTANCYRILEDFDKAEEYMFRSISIKEKLAKNSPLWSSLGIGYFNLADIYLKRNQLKKAENYYSQSYQIFSDSNHIIGLGSVYLAKGEIEFNRGNIVAAKELWEKARKLFSSNNLKLYTNKAVKNLSLLEKK